MANVYNSIFGYMYCILTSWKNLEGQVVKKKIIVLGSLMLLAMAFYGLYGKFQKQEDLPVIRNTTDYPALTLEELSEKAFFILEVQVAKVNDSILEEYGPYTPVTLEIKQVIKGEDKISQIVYYEDGGETPSYYVQPSGYAMEEGLEFIVFLNEQGYAWGGQSLFPVIGDKIILSEAAVEYIGEENISTLQQEEIVSNIRSQISTTTVNVANKEEFISIVSSIIE